MTDKEIIEDQEVELHDEVTDEVVEEAHDPKNAEQQSVDSVNKADDMVKKAPARKGDNSKQDPMPKTKAGMINAMYTKMNGMKKEQLMAAYNKMHEEWEDEDMEVVAEKQDSVSGRLL
jgi:hypothetical protein